MKGPTSPEVNLGGSSVLGVEAFTRAKGSPGDGSERDPRHPKLWRDVGPPPGGAWKPVVFSSPDLHRLGRRVSDVGPVPGQRRRRLGGAGAGDLEAGPDPDPAGDPEVQGPEEEAKQPKHGDAAAGA